MSKNILVHLGGVDVTSYLINDEKTQTYGDAISRYVLEFTKNVNEAVTISNTLTVEVWLDSSTPPTTKVFDGFIDLFKPEKGTIEITAKDKLAYLVNKPVMKEYDSGVTGDPSNPDGKISDIFDPQNLVPSELKVKKVKKATKAKKTNESTMKEVK